MYKIIAWLKANILLFTFGLITAQISTIADAYFFEVPGWVACINGGAIAIFIGIFKEAFDCQKDKSKFDNNGWIASALGGVVGSLLLLSMILI